MVSIAGSKKLKRQMAPQFWGITRKSKRFVVTVKPGAHPKEFAVPLAVFLRDTLQIVKTLREAKASIYGSKLKVDGVVRKSLHHGLGLMDVIELQGVDKIYFELSRKCLMASRKCFYNLPVASGTANSGCAPGFTVTTNRTPQL